MKINHEKKFHGFTTLLKIPRSNLSGPYIKCTMVLSGAPNFLRLQKKAPTVGIPQEVDGKNLNSFTFKRTWFTATFSNFSPVVRWDRMINSKFNTEESHSGNMKYKRYSVDYSFFLTVTRMKLLRIFHRFFIPTSVAMFGINQWKKKWYKTYLK